VPLFGEILNEHLCRDGDDECSITGATVDVVVDIDDLFYSRDYFLLVNNIHDLFDLSNVVMRAGPLRPLVEALEYCCKASLALNIFFGAFPSV
jgi:hypothetical protein